MDTITIKLGDSTQQKADIALVKLSAHNMAAAALDFTKNGSQGYDQYLLSKEQFDNVLETVSKNYRYCRID